MGIKLAILKFIEKNREKDKPVVCHHHPCERNLIGCIYYIGNCNQANVQYMITWAKIIIQQKCNSLSKFLQINLVNVFKQVVNIMLFNLHKQKPSLWWSIIVIVGFWITCSHSTFMVSKFGNHALLSHVVIYFSLKNINANFKVQKLSCEEMHCFTILSTSEGMMGVLLIMMCGKVKIIERLFNNQSYYVKTFTRKRKLLVIPQLNNRLPLVQLQKNWFSLFWRMTNQLFYSIFWVSGIQSMYFKKQLDVWLGRCKELSIWFATFLTNHKNYRDTIIVYD